MKWTRILPALAALVGFVVVAHADQVQDGKKFVPAMSGYNRLVPRTVDSTEAGGRVHRAGMVDSSVYVPPPANRPIVETVGGIYRPDTSSRAFTMDNVGNLQTVDGYAPSWGTAYFANAVNDTFTVGNSLTATAGTTQTPFCFDSTIVYPFNNAGFTKLTLYMRSIPPVDSAVADTGSATYWGIQIRKHPTSASDSSNTAVWYEWAGVPTGQTGANADSVVQAGFTYPRTPALPFPGERIFKFDDHLGGVNINQPASSMTGPPMLAVDVGSPNAPFNAPYFDVRVHCIARVKSLANANPSRRPRFVLGVWMGP